MGAEGIVCALKPLCSSELLSRLKHLLRRVRIFFFFLPEPVFRIFVFFFPPKIGEGVSRWLLGKEKTNKTDVKGELRQAFIRIRKAKVR